jgi:hypothetical protein
MPHSIRYIIRIALLFSLAASPSLGQETVKEPSTGKAFPAVVKFSQGGKDYALTLTGVAVRKKIVFKVYGIAHYMQDPAKTGKEEVFKSVLADGKAKQLTMDFARTVSPTQVQDAYRDGFKENATAEELKAIQPMVDRFLAYFTNDVKENDKFTLRWLPGGTIVAIIHEEEKPAITNETFARVLWTIWFGKDSIVDREDLIDRIVAKD